MTESKKTDTTIPNNVIKYEASEKLWGEYETESLLGPYPRAFNVSIRKHTFCNGKGTIAFKCDVTAINDYAFHGCTGLTSVTIPNSVMSIGEGAFARCLSLTSINIPNSVVRIEEMAFCEKEYNKHYEEFDHRFKYDENAYYVIIFDNMQVAVLKNRECVLSNFNRPIINALIRKKGLKHDNYKTTA